MARTRLSPSPRRARSALGVEEIARGFASFPGLAHRMEQVGRAGQGAVRQRFQGDQRRRRRKGAAFVPRHLLDPRRQAERGRHRAAASAVPARRQSLSDRRGERGFRGDARRRSPVRALRDARGRARRRRARRRLRARRPSRSCCFRRPAPPTTNSPISKCAATAFARSSPSASRCESLEGAPHDLESRTRPGRRLVAQRRPLAARLLRRADGGRRRDGARGEPGGRRTPRPLRPSISSIGRPSCCCRRRCCWSRPRSCRRAMSAARR